MFASLFVMTFLSRILDFVQFHSYNLFDSFALSGMPYMRILRNSGSFDITSFETKLHNDFIDQLNTNFQRLHNFGVTDNNGRWR